MSDTILTYDGLDEPLLIKVTSYCRIRPWRGSAATAPSDLDYYGYTEIEWYVVDNSGAVRLDLTAALSKETSAHIESFIERYYEG